MKRLTYILCMAVILTATQACKQSEVVSLVNDGGAPGPVSNASVENMAGAAKITYTLPENPIALHFRMGLVALT